MPLPYHAGKSKLAKHISNIVFKKAEENPVMTDNQEIIEDDDIPF